MSSALNLRPNDYVTPVMLTAVGYDYILTFSNELEYIWRRPWTHVSVLFILVRYVGLYSLVSFLPGPAKVCHIIGITDDWAFCLFFGAADFVMLLRVWALYNRSRLILGTLLVLFFLEIIYIIVPTALYSTYPTYIPDVATQTPSCAVVLPPVSTKVGAAVQIINGTALCTLAIVQFVVQSLQMYRITKRLQINQYVNLIVKQGILYFFVYVPSYLLSPCPLLLPELQYESQKANYKFPS
ncbi:hypothetical protein L210DRAFT_3536138 [Boletus edulis BED1]|uniref:DUF6533 domain-containing protein n=1 Tax=Boletus edulis BED1 TaxID=1328754 RepID=A0AAD4BWX4_BOLED|nr:hypothetical protein L210DRAFT_3536138 [Boletus edulis BED1]